MGVLDFLVPYYPINNTLVGFFYSFADGHSKLIPYLYISYLAVVQNGPITKIP